MDLKDRYTNNHSDKNSERYADRYSELYSGLNKNIENKDNGEVKKRSNLYRNLKWFFIVWFIIGLIRAIAMAYDKNNIRYIITVIVANTLFMLTAIAIILLYVKIRGIVKRFIINNIK